MSKVWARVLVDVQAQIAWVQVEKPPGQKTIIKTPNAANIRHRAQRVVKQINERSTRPSNPKAKLP
jgi:hypothetical protein